MIRTLDADQLDCYARDGFVLLRGLFSRANLEAFDTRFQALVNHTAPLSARMKIMNDVMVVKGAVTARSAEHAVNKLMSFEDDPALYDFVTNPDLLRCVRGLLGDDVYSVSTNVFNKPPGVDGRHPMHQDLRYYRIRPPEGIVGVWTAIRPAPRETGCLAVIPGSHKRGLLQHESPDWEYLNHGFHGVQDVDRAERVHIEMDPGDTLLFHPLLIHGSGRNRSDQYRRAISAHYAAADCESPAPDWRDNPYVRRLPWLGAVPG
jgi:phytanoyl-CoA hydroxylase